MGRIQGEGLRLTPYQGLCGRSQDGPSAALGVEVEQGAARKARDKLRQGERDDRDEF